MTAFIMWLNSIAGKMRKILCFDWLPKHILPTRNFPRQSRKEKLSFSPYNKSFIDQQTCSVKVAGYRPPSILRFYRPCLRLRRKWKIYNTTFQGPHDSINKWDVNNITIEEMEDMRRNIFTYWLSKHFGSQGIGLYI